MASVSEIRNKFESKVAASGTKWRSGVQNPNRTPGDGLNAEVEGLDNLDGQTLTDYNNAWSSNSDSDEVQTKFEENAENSGEKWERNWGDASNWTIGE